MGVYQPAGRALSCWEQEAVVVCRGWAGVWRWAAAPEKCCLLCRSPDMEINPQIPPFSVLPLKPQVSDLQRHLLSTPLPQPCARHTITFPSLVTISCLKHLHQVRGFKATSKLFCTRILPSAFVPSYLLPNTNSPPSDLLSPSISSPPLSPLRPSSQPSQSFPSAETCSFFTTGLSSAPTGCPARTTAGFHKGTGSCPLHFWGLAGHKCGLQPSKIHWGGKLRVGCLVWEERKSNRAVPVPAVCLICQQGY